MMTLQSASSVLLFGVTLLAALGAGEQQGQGGARKRSSRPHLKTELVPDFQVDKMMGFKVLRLPKSQYIFSRAEVAEFPGALLGSSHPQKVVYITYGFKSGGLARLYETKPLSSLTPTQLEKAISQSGVFHDSYGNPNFVSKAVVRGGVEAVVTGLSQKLVIDAIARLQ